MENNKIGTVEAIVFLVIISITSIILSSSQIIVNMCASSSLLNILLISFIILIITVIFCLLAKPFLGKNLLDISSFLGGKILKTIIGLCFFSFFIFTNSIILRKLSNCLEILYYPMTNVMFIIALFCITAGIGVFFKNNSVFKVSYILFPILFFAIILIFIGNTKNFDFNNIYPILGNGINATFLSGISNIFSFSGFAYLFFIPDKLKKPKNFTKISIISIILSSIFLLFCCANIMLLFDERFSNTELFPLYIAVRCIEFGSFFQRLDSIFLSLCILSFICSFSLSLYISTDILKSVTNMSDNRPFVFPCVLITFGISLCLKVDSTIELLEGNVSKVFFIVFAIIIPFIILGLANILRKNKIKKQT